MGIRPLNGEWQQAPLFSLASTVVHRLDGLLGGEGKLVKKRIANPCRDRNHGQEFRLLVVRVTVLSGVGDFYGLDCGNVQGHASLLLDHCRPCVYSHFKLAQLIAPARLLSSGLGGSVARSIHNRGIPVIVQYNYNEVCAKEFHWILGIMSTMHHIDQSHSTSLLLHIQPRSAPISTAS